MAKLEGRNPEFGMSWFSLTPIAAAMPGNDATEYTFELCSGPNNLTWNRTFSVAEWFTEQDDLWVLARAFVETPVLINTTIPIDLWRTGGGTPAYLSKHVDWLHIDLWGNKNQKWVNVIIFVQVTADSHLFQRNFLRTSVEEAVEFGRRLEKEIIETCPAWAKENNHCT